MVNPFSRSAAVLLAALVVFITLASGQTPVTDFNQKQAFDVQHYTLRTSFDAAAKKVFGDTTIKIRPVVAGLASVELDAVGLSVSSVKLESSEKPLKFLVRPGKLDITLDRPYGPSDEISIRIKHSAVPKKGVYFVPERKDGAELINPEQIWTQGEPDEARHWFPLFDFPSDKATTEQFITVRKGQTAISNGELVNTTANPDGTLTFHYRMDVPHSTYLISFIVGDYVKVEDKYGEVPLGFYVYRGRESIVPQAYGKTAEMMRIFEGLTGIKYPFNKYDQTIVANFTFGGMENITATTMADSEIFYASVPFLRGAVEDLVAHELAHSWFGNLVTCRNWAELWLNEGFATFMEAAVREKLYGRRDYIRKIGIDAEMFKSDDAVTRNRFGLYNRTAGNVAALFDRPAITYNKGGAVIHQLREQVGDEAFWKAISTYLERHKFGNVETPDLRRAMEEASSQKLDWFFEQWVYGIGYPKLDIKHRYDPVRKVLVLAVTQTQPQDRLTPPAFRLPLELELTDGNGTAVMRKIEVTRRIESIEVPADFRPTAIKVDPAEKVPLKDVKLAPAR